MYKSVMMTALSRAHELGWLFDLGSGPLGIVYPPPPPPPQTSGNMYKWSFWCFQQLQGYAFVCIIPLIPKDRVCGFMNSNFLWWYTKQRLWEPLLHFIWNALKVSSCSLFVSGLQVLHLIKELNATSFEVPSVSFENFYAGWKKHH